MKFKGFIGDREHDVDVEAIEGGYAVTVDGIRHEIDAVACEGSFYSLLRGNQSYDVSVRESGRDTLAVRHGGYRCDVRLVDPLAVAASAHGDEGSAEITAIMPGRVVKFLVEEGQEVEAGQGVLVLEAMKMENEVQAPRRGRLARVLVRAGATVESGEVLAIVE
ncbi:MAG: biotin/lipoyl-binding protein [Acidobacteria bacterium]|nr:biotin/lipoyl-binding protein [Acidobacteriota bacterium]